MGTWGGGPFSNDTASDYLADLDEAGSGLQLAAVLRMRLEAVTASGESYLDADEGAEGVAAAAVIASLGGTELADLEPHAGDVLAKLSLEEGQLAELRPPAVAAVDRIVADNSELLDLWQEAGEDAQFRASCARIRDALAG